MKPLLQHAIDLVLSADSIQYTEHGFWWLGHCVADAFVPWRFTWAPNDGGFQQIPGCPPSSPWPVHGYITASEENDGRKIWTPMENC